MTDKKYDPVDSFGSDMIDVVAKAIFTGIMYGGHDDEWNELPEERVFHSKSMMRNGAIDVLRAMRLAGVDV